MKIFIQIFSKKLLLIIINFEKYYYIGAEKIIYI